jgi:hypothetical protein
MAEVTKRDLVVWSAYIGSALDLTAHDLGDDVKKSLAKSKVALDSARESGELKGADANAILKACEAGIAACELEDGTHPVVASKVRVVVVNLGAVVEQIGGVKSGRASSKTTEDTLEPGDPGPLETDVPDGKVDCPCGKRHDAGSKVLAKHQAKAAG